MIYSDGRKVELLDRVVIRDGLTGIVVALPGEGHFSIIHMGEIDVADAFWRKHSGVFVLTDEFGLVSYEDATMMKKADS